MSKKRKLLRKAWAFLLAFVMLVSLIPSNLKAAYAAEVSGSEITISFMNHTKDALVVGDPGIKEDNACYYLVTTIRDTSTDPKTPIGYNYLVLDNNNDITKPEITKNLGGFIKVSDKTGMIYDPEDAQYSNTDMVVRLYKFTGENNPNLGSLTYEQLTDTTDDKISDTIPGYTFESSSVDKNTGKGSIVLYKNDKETKYRTTLDFSDDNGTISKSDKYFVLVTVGHQNSNPSYYMQFIDTTGDTTITVNEWYDSNGNKVNEVFTGNEVSVDVCIKKADDTINPDAAVGATDYLSYNMAVNNNHCALVPSGSKIGNYSVAYPASKEHADGSDDNYLYYTQTITLTKGAEGTKHTIDEILGDAINFGVTANGIKQIAHSETNVATNTFYNNGNGQNLEPDLSSDLTGLDGYDRFKVMPLTDEQKEQNLITGDFYVGDYVDCMILGTKPVGKTANVYSPESTFGMSGSTNKLRSNGGIIVNPITRSKEDVATKVNGMVSTTDAIATSMIAEPATLTPTIINGVAYIDTWDYSDDATIYIDADDYLDYIAANNGVCITKKPTQLIVFNFKNDYFNQDTSNPYYGGNSYIANDTSAEDPDEKKQIKINTFLLRNTKDGVYSNALTDGSGKYLTDKNQTADIVAQQVVWNLYNVPSAQTIETGGLFLMHNPNSVLELGRTSCGWAVSAGRVNLGRGGEFHFVYRGLKNSSSLVSGSLKLSKSQSANSTCTIGDDTEFTFNVSFSNTNQGVDLSKIKFSPSTANVTKASGSDSYTVKIKKGDANAVTFTGIPDGTKYTVVENVASPYELESITDKNITTTDATGSGATCTVDKKTVEGTIDVSTPAKKTTSFEYTNKMNGPDVDISKQSLGGTELKGASITITRKDDANFKFTSKNVTFGNGTTDTNERALVAGDTKIEFKSGSSVTVLHNLPDGTYVMSELAAPEGYLKATEIEFKVQNGAVVADAENHVTAATEATATAGAQNARVTMVDGDAGDLSISKKLVGATLTNLNSIVFEVEGPTGFGKKEIKLDTLTAATTDWTEVSGSYVYTFKNVPAGEYTVTEKENGEKGSFGLKSTTVVPNNGGKVIVPAQGKGEITYTNTYEEVASLKVTKSVTGDAPDADNRTFEFTLTLKKGTDPYANKTIGLPNGAVQTSQTDANGQVKFKLKKGESVIISDIPVGLKYTLSEIVDADAVKYGYTFATDTAETAIASGVNEVTVTNTYSEQKVVVSVTKVWDDGDSADRPASVSVQLKKNGTNEGAAVTLNSTNSWKNTWNDLPKYSYDKNTNTWSENTYSVDEIVPNGYSKEITTNSTSSPYEYTITNKKIVQPVGDLSVTKKVNGGDATKQAPDAADRSFTIEVILKDGNDAYANKDINLSQGSAASTIKTDADGKVTLTLKAGESAKLANIKQGVSYTVNEILGTDIRYGYDTTSYTGTISGTESIVTVNNTYTEKLVEIAVTKVWDDKDNASGARPSSVSVKLKKDGADYKNATLNAADNWAYTWDKLPKYEYASGQWNEISYTIDEVAVSGYEAPVITAPTLTGTTAAGVEQYAATVTNKIKETPAPDKGYIDITKTIKGEVSEEDLKGLSFTVTKVGETTGTTYELGKDFVKNANTGVYELKNKIEVNVGDKYTITENLVKLDGITETVSYEIIASDSTKTKGSGVKTGEFGVEKGKTTTVAYENDYAVDKGSIKITKTISGPVTEEDLKGLTFTIYDSDNKQVGNSYVLGKDFKKDAATGIYEKQIDNIKVGTYTVKETLYKVDGTQCTVTYKIDNGAASIGDTASASVKKDTVTTVAYKDDYKHEVKISKVDATNSKEIAGATLVLYRVEANGDLTKLTSWISSATEVYTFALDAGNYAIEETIAPDGYEKKTSHVKFNLSFDAEGNAVTKVTEGPGTYDAKNDKITFENDPIKVTGKLSVHVVEEKTDRDVPNATVEVEGPDGTKKTYKTNDKGEIVDEKGGTPIVVTPGTYKITVTEVPAGYEVTTGETATVTVPKDGEARHEAKILPKTGGLKIRVLEEGTNREVPNATVEVEASNGVKFPDGSTKITVTTDEHGNITSYKDKDGKIIDLTTGLEPGDYKVTVTKVPDGYKVSTGQTKTVTVKKGEVTEHLALIGTATKEDTTETKTEQPTTEQPKQPTTEVKQPTTTTTPNAPSTPQKDSTVVNTGDSMNVVPIIVVMILALIGIVVLIIKKRRMRYEY